MRGMTAPEKKAYRADHAWTQMGSKSKARVAATAQAAEIPRIISKAVCELASHYIPDPSGK